MNKDQKSDESEAKKAGPDAESFFEPMTASGGKRKGEKINGEK